MYIPPCNVEFLSDNHGISIFLKMRWRPKIRDKNKLRLNMKNILNPRLMKEKIIVIEDSSSQEDMEEEESLSSQQVHIKVAESSRVIYRHR